ncbi:MAG: glycoside hydrolase family 28 protein [Prevotella sp.]|nr:glycoside hydrolase family 28 protein [Prevotella sp.]
MKQHIALTGKAISLCAALIFAATIHAATLNVKNFGAKGDGKTLDSPAINATIEACVSKGGGTVTVPAGNYLCGSIHLKSNIELHLDAGATITATDQKGAYDPSEEFGFPEYQDGGHTYFHNSLIWAEGQTNVSITGRGMIDGLGLTRRDTETAGNVQGGSIGMGDKAIALKLCRNVLIRDITIYRGGHFAIIITGCEYATIDNVLIDTNRDGIDIDCCRNTTVSNTKVNTPHDDALVLKSSYALKKAVTCENILITNCTVTGYKLGTTLDGTYVPETVNWVCGRIKLGTESNGGYRNITISNCTCIHSSGLAFEEVDQGTMENIVVTGISMSHVHHYPIYITTGRRNRGPKERTDVSSARDISISNIVADDCDALSGIQVTGMEGHPIENVRLSNILLRFRGGGKKVDENYPELGEKYPEVAKFLGTCPAYGLFARHVRGLQLSDVTFILQQPDERPCIITNDVEDLRMRNVRTPEGWLDN